MADNKIKAVLHSRYFGRQASFLSGMEYIKKRGGLFLDLDRFEYEPCLEDFLVNWKKGNKITYGIYSQSGKNLSSVFEKFFYRVFNIFSIVKIPILSSDIALLDYKTVRDILQFKEKSFYLKGIRSFLGHSQVGIPLALRRRVDSSSLKNLSLRFHNFRNGLIAFSNTPLALLSLAGLILFGCSFLASLSFIVLKLINDDFAPRGFTVVILCILFFGSLNLFGISLLGEYIGKIFDEVKRRPLFIRDKVIINTEEIDSP